MVHGKSTLAKLIAGIVKPTKGQVLIEGKDTKKKENFLEIRKQVGIVFQNPENQIIFNSVEDEIRFGLENLNMGDIEAKTREALKKVGLEEHHNKFPNQLSRRRTTKSINSKSNSKRPCASIV